MTPDRDLQRMLAKLDVHRRDGVFVFVSTRAADANLAAAAHAIVREDEGVSYVVPESDAHTLGHAGHFRSAWLTLGVHSALDAVGLTATVSSALAAHGIACNMIAGQHHDHLLVPVARCDEALVALSVLAADHGARA